VRRILLLAAVASLVAADSATPLPAVKWHSGRLVVHVKQGGIALRARPGGRVVGRVGPRTAYGSPLTMPVVRTRKDRWLGVVTPAMPKGRLAWIDGQAGGLRFTRTRIVLRVDLSQRTIAVRSGGHTIRRIRVAVGRRGTPTPTGRFAVTDKLPGRRYGSYYGCCILALSGWQTRLPSAWRGPGRLAIHGSPRRDAGGATSLGCLHAGPRDLRFLMRVVPVGAQVIIRR
jgi:hypothetical protein